MSEELERKCRENREMIEDIQDKIDKLGGDSERVRKAKAFDELEERIKGGEKSDEANNSMSSGSDVKTSEDSKPPSIDLNDPDTIEDIYQSTLKDEKPPEQTERLCIGCSDKFEGGVHAYMCGTCANILLNEGGIIVLREDLIRWRNHLKLHQGSDYKFSQWVIDELNTILVEKS